MNEEEKIEINREDGKPEDTGQVHKEAKLVNEETSSMNEQADHTSYITTSDISNMEVHHPNHVTHKKKWGEYLLEFLMLFLAVTLGFFAENVREHVGDVSKEKEYMSAMFEELKSDTVEYNKALDQIFYLRPLLDSLIINVKNA